MAGLPLEELDDMTCMEVANAPNMDLIARKGVVGTARNVPKGMTPASDVANLSIFGYDPQKYYCGRGPLEAANLGVELGENDVAFRFNTVTVHDGKMVDYCAGHISTKEVAVLTDRLSTELGGGKFSFYPGTSYRNLMVAHCAGPEEAENLAKLKCVPPHDISDKNIAKYLPKDPEITDLMKRSISILEGNDINKVRIDLGQNPANMIWIWGQGKRPDMPVFSDAYNVSGGVISAVDLIKGMGRVLGLDVIDVPGATGYYDTDYEGKASAALKVLEDKDLVYVHVEAPDEAGHNGDIREKIRAIENFDRKITGSIISSLEKKGCGYRVMMLPDHPTPVKLKTHTSDPVPFAMFGTGIDPDDVTVFTERSARSGSMLGKKGSDLMRIFLRPDW
jgi:2,3-bisphosphoglycerate-independent phosphoglycerate mutase